MSERGMRSVQRAGANANAAEGARARGYAARGPEHRAGWDFAAGSRATEAQMPQRGGRRARRQFVGSSCRAGTLGSVVGLARSASRWRTPAMSRSGCGSSATTPTSPSPRAWQLSSDVQQAASLDDLFARSDFVSFTCRWSREPRGWSTRIACERCATARCCINFARE